MAPLALRQSDGEEVDGRRKKHPGLVIALLSILHDELVLMQR
jgi:hypothetical protein